MKAAVKEPDRRGFALVPETANLAAETMAKLVQLTLRHLEELK